MMVLQMFQYADLDQKKKLTADTLRVDSIKLSGPVDDCMIDYLVINVSKRIKCII